MPGFGKLKRKQARRDRDRFFFRGEAVGAAYKTVSEFSAPEEEYRWMEETVSVRRFKLPNRKIAFLNGG